MVVWVRSVSVTRGFKEVKKKIMLPWQMLGSLLLFMAIRAALTGLIEKASFLQLEHHSENGLMNFLGLTNQRSISLTYLWVFLLFLPISKYVYEYFVIFFGSSD